VFDEFDDEIGGSLRLPWEFKESLCEDGQRLHDVAVSCTLTNSCTHSKETHVMIVELDSSCTQPIATPDGKNVYDDQNLICILGRITRRFDRNCTAV